MFYEMPLQFEHRLQMNQSTAPFPTDMAFRTIAKKDGILHPQWLQRLHLLFHKDAKDGVRFCWIVGRDLKNSHTIKF